MALLTKRFQQWAKKNKKLSSKRSGSRGSGSKDNKEDQNMCFNCKKTGHFIADSHKLSSKDKVKKRNFNKENFKNKIKKSLIATWEDVDNDLEVEEDEEANLALMATASEDTKSDSESRSDSNKEQEVFHELTQSELIDTLKDVIKLYTRKSRDYKLLKGIYNSLNDSANKLIKENKFLNNRICFFLKENYK
jgi:hypothetical protein